MIYKREAKILRLLKKNKPIPRNLLQNGSGVSNLESEKYVLKEYITPPGEDISIQYKILPKGLDALSEYNRQKTYKIISLTVAVITLILTIWSCFADDILQAFN